MRRAGIISILLLCFSSAVHAGPFTDDMARCLVVRSSEADKTLLVQWLYIAMSAHPAVKHMSNISNELRQDVNRQAALMIMDLLTERCRDETEKAVKYDGESSIEASFEILGRVAMQGLMSDPEVGEYLSSLEKYFDAEKLTNSLDQ